MDTFHHPGVAVDVLVQLVSFPLHSHSYISILIMDTPDVPKVVMTDRERISQLEQAQYQLINQ